jgi:uncharacterized membrane protein YkoI
LLASWAFFAPQNEENVVFRFMGWIGTSAVVGLVVLTAGGRADDKKISPDKLPAKVKAALNDRFPGATVTSAEKEIENGQVVYDLELKHDGRKYEMDVKEDGTIMEIEKEVAFKDLPEAVTKALGDKFPKANYEEFMEVNKVEGKKETPTHYEVTLVTADKKKLEVEVSLEGKILKSGKAEEDKS